MDEHEKGASNAPVTKLAAEHGSRKATGVEDEQDGQDQGLHGGQTVPLRLKGGGWSETQAILRRLVRARSYLVTSSARPIPITTAPSIIRTQPMATSSAQEVEHGQVLPSRKITLSAISVTHYGQCRPFAFRVTLGRRSGAERNALGRDRFLAAQRHENFRAIGPGPALRSRLLAQQNQTRAHQHAGHGHLTRHTRTPSWRHYSISILCWALGNHLTASG